MNQWPDREQPCRDAAARLLDHLPDAIPYDKKHYSFLMPLPLPHQAITKIDTATPCFLSICIPPDRNYDVPSFVEAALLNSERSVIYNDAWGYSINDESLGGVVALGPTDGTPVSVAHAKAIRDEVARLGQFVKPTSSGLP
jgi:hypothetical protein